MIEEAEIEIQADKKQMDLILHMLNVFKEKNLISGLKWTRKSYPQ